MFLVVISGLSGSGKSVALNVLEDADFYCVDNLPATLLPETVDFLGSAAHSRLAVTIDARSGASLAQLPTVLGALRERGIDARLVLLTARDDSLVRRFSETRRKHPLSDGTRTIEECIALERDLMEPLADYGHSIDTSALSPNGLRAWIKDLLVVGSSRLTLVFESFGFKEGIPLNADLVFDVRHLPNPFYDPKLRPLTGLDAEVAEFLAEQPDVRALLDDIGNYIQRWLPSYIRDNRAYLTVALGCTGGRHRSVYLAEQLARRFRPDNQVLVRHRHLHVL
jgi:UPF0042 nucleotide-binding protein